MLPDNCFNLERRQILVGMAAALGTAAGASADEPAPASRPAPPVGVKMIPNIEYAAPGGVPNLLDLYLPAVAPAKPIPAILYIHGGAWLEGDKRPCLAAALVPLGFAVVSVNYRLSAQATYPAQIFDCKAAVRWTRAHAKFYDIDSRRIGVIGVSAGGHLAALLGTSGDVAELEGDLGNLDQSSVVQAVVDFCGPTDLSLMVAPVKPGQRPPATPITKLLGGHPSELPKLAAMANPVTYITAKAAPFMIVHGANDKIVPPSQSQILHDALKKAGVPVTLKIIPGADHGLAGVNTLDMANAFFTEQLYKTNVKAR